MRRWLLIALLLLVPRAAALASDIQVIKTARPDIATGVIRPLQPGDGIVFTIEVTNVGTTTASGVAVVDSLPPGTTMRELFLLGDPWSCSAPAQGNAGSITCTLTNLGPGERRRFVFTADLAQTYSTPGRVVNTATVTTTSTDPNPLNNTSTASLDVGPAIPTLTTFGFATFIAILAGMAIRRA